jgi:O-methyltransferase involved in polyketide biosynthesis
MWRLMILKWSEAIKNYPNKWLLFEAIEAYSKDGQRIIEDISIINVFDEGRDALKEYAEKHKKDKSREMYVYHIKNIESIIEERNWIGVRKYG